MDKKIFGIFLAGGMGTRMGASVPKQFLEIDGKPILQVTIEKFVAAIPSMNVITVLPEQYRQDWADSCTVHALDVPQIIVDGGITRFHSVRNALEKVPDGAVVFIHDGVRPLTSPGLILSMLEKMDTERALVPVVPVTDTLKSVDRSLPDPDRSAVVAVQTPQVFLSEDIKKAYTTAYDVRFTDDASVAEKSGIPVTFVPGEKNNIKVTTPEDLILARLLSDS